MAVGGALLRLLSPARGQANGSFLARKRFDREFMPEGFVLSFHRPNPAGTLLQLAGCASSRRSLRWTRMVSEIKLSTRRSSSAPSGSDRFL